MSSSTSKMLEDRFVTGTKDRPAPSWLSIEHLKTYMRTSALVFAIKAWLDIENSGHGDGTQLLDETQHAFVAKDARNKKTAGMLIYDKKNEQGIIRVRLGFVDVTYRRKGVYSHLWRALVKLARKDDATRIVGVTHAKNRAMLKLAESLGRKRAPLIRYDFAVQGESFPESAYPESA